MHAAANRKMGEGDGKVLTRDGSFELMSNDGKLILVNDVTGESFSTLEAYEQDAAYLMRVNEHYMVICASGSFLNIDDITAVCIYQIENGDCTKVCLKYFGSKTISAELKHTNSLFLDFEDKEVCANITMQGLTDLEYSHKDIDSCSCMDIVSFKPLLSLIVVFLVFFIYQAIKKL
ncbi:hypothetical protein PCE1_003560 [Barthelona sp. PCE]